MKNVFLVLFTGWLCGLCIAQKNIPLLDRKISVGFEQTELPIALLDISKKADFNLSFNPMILPENRVVNARHKSINPISLMEKILPANVDIQHCGNSVVLVKKYVPTPKKSSMPALLSLSGLIQDQAAGQPLQGVTIIALQNEESALTDSNGAFVLSMSPKIDQIVLSFNKRGYCDTTITLPVISHNIRIQLRKVPSPPTLSAKSLENTRIESRELSKIFIPHTFITNAENVEGYQKKLFQVSLVPGLSSNLKLAGTVKNTMSLNIIGGYSYGVNAVEVAGAINIAREHVKYAQIAGLFNLTGGNVEGVQIGGANNLTMGNVKGVQIGGANNFTKGQQKGLQVAGAVNTNLSSVEGLQIAGAVNTAKKLQGVQLSGAVNVCDTLQGAQIGVFNYSKVQKGFQLGVVNVSDSIAGVSIGLVTLAKKNGYAALHVSANEVLPLQVTLHLGQPKFYNIFSLGYGHYSSNMQYQMGVGLGSQVAASAHWTAQVDLTANWLSETIEMDSKVFLAKGACLLTYKMGDHLGITFGPSVNVSLHDLSIEDVNGFEPIAPYQFIDEQSAKKRILGWLGFEAGLKYRF